MPISTIAVKQLQDGLQRLPQELYDQVYALTFTIEAGKVVLDRNYQIPSQLQVCRHFREKLLKNYYAATIWLLWGEPCKPFDRNGIPYVNIDRVCVLHWLNSLSQDAMDIFAAKQFDRRAPFCVKDLRLGRGVDARPLRPGVHAVICHSRLEDSFGPGLFELYRVS
ncbi:uncharacterized protein RCC_12057 [Ramularia collo-cygni]|uniref:Uncharacterized protein n=1 Tax=Ramularia collo-cygni TaxID=112498 RepID=A0A2D3UMA1_9PEZI|nr:uncharacterized protein RCC_12057 [Ramularia collo-cygni]CZT15021.1 uncharacterized protein RCC_12057 [Ramularia collo-cygni]